MAGNTPILIGKKSQEALVQFLQQAYQLQGQQWNLRSQMEQIDREYAREVDNTVEQAKARLANIAGDPTKYQNVIIPTIKPAVEAAVTYQSSVFLTGNPLFGVVADPATEDAAIQMETTIDSQATRGRWKEQFQMAFRDGFKYNLMALEVCWGREITAAIETDITFEQGKIGKPVQTIWEGNRIKRMDLYNTFWDTRVAPVNVHTHGEFAGYVELMSRVALKKYFAELPDKMVDNVKTAFESGFVGTRATGGAGVGSYFIPQINWNTLIRKDDRYTTTNWLAWASISGADDASSIKYQDMYQVTTLYGRILPLDFGIRVPSAATPQIWKFVFVNNQVLVYAERQTNAHGWLPILFGQPNEDGLEYQTKSLAQDESPFQYLSSALMSSVIAARRRAISDRVLYNPLLVTDAQINNPNPSAKIPVRPNAYSRPLSEAVYAFPFKDDQSGLILQLLPTIGSYANRLASQNQAKQGQFVKGNKTLHEYADVMAHANGPDQMISILLEDQLFTPLKTILKFNILQYQGGTSLYNRAKETIVKIDPIVLRNAVLEFKISDGLIPSDKLINADSFQVAMQAVGSSAQIGAAYNIGPMFSYLMKTQGAILTPFEKPPEQIAYEQALNVWQQTIMEAMKQGVSPEKLPKQPIPQQFGYTPGKVAVSNQNTQLSQGTQNGNSNT